MAFEGITFKYCNCEAQELSRSPTLCRTVFGPCFPCWSFNYASNRTVLGQPPQPYLDPYSNKEIPFRRALRRLHCSLGSQLGIHRKLGLSPLGTVHATVLGHSLTVIAMSEELSQPPDASRLEKLRAKLPCLRHLWSSRNGLRKI